MDQNGSELDEKSKKALENLPLASKLQILSQLDLGIQKKILSPDSDMLPGVEFIRNLDSNPNLAKKLRKFSREDLIILENDGVLIRDGILGQGVGKLARLEAERFQDQMKPARMGREHDAWLDTTTRGDIITWLNGEKRSALESSAPHLFSVLKKMDAMRKELNETCKFDSQHTQAQLACYPGNGTHYVKHLDAFVGGSSRRITCIYYLNFEWKKSDGGCLRIHNDESTKDVEPIGDRMVIFQSRRVWHEVMPSFTSRFAIAMWFY